VAAALIFVSLRGYIRIYRRERPTLSDGFVLLAWLSFVSCCACDIRLNQLGLFQPGRTYEMALTTINSDPDLNIEALKVPIGHFDGS